jgi:hypothetical protein
MSSYLDEVIKQLEKQMEFVKKTNGQLQLMGDSIEKELKKNIKIRDSLKIGNIYQLNAFESPDNKAMLQVRFHGSSILTIEMFDKKEERDKRYKALQYMLLPVEERFKKKAKEMKKEKNKDSST